MNIWMEDQEPRPLWKPNNNFLFIVTVIKKFNPLHPNISIHILYTGADKENLSNNQEFL